MVIYDRYDRELVSWAAANDVRTPVVPIECEHTAHMFHLRFERGINEIDSSLISPIVA
jgi:hypothetical protein